jgi:glycosyltransferase involved in cell wall biosynthesis
MSFGWLKAEVEENSLSDYFVFEGMKPVEIVPAYTFIADGLIACLNRIDNYGFAIPAKVLSYFAAGKPILLAIDGEIQDTINDNNFGFAGAAEDSEQLYLNIKKLYNMSIDERLEMGRRVKEHHYENYEWNKCFDKLEQFVRD